MKKNIVAQRGFTIIEMMIVVAIATAVYQAFIAAVDFANKRSRGEVIATSLEPYHVALFDYGRRFRTELQNNTAIAGVANIYAPTAAELKVVQALSNNYPNTLAALDGGVPGFRVDRIPVGCVATACDLAFTFWSARPVLDGRGTLSSAAGFAARKIGGNAGVSDYDTPGSITGLGGWSIANPAGAVTGIIAVYRTYSASTEARYLTQGDSRDPQFAGGATITGGTTSVASLAVTGTAVLNGTLSMGCIGMQASNGRAGFGCLNRDTLPAGYTGGVVSPDVVASRNLLVSDNRQGFTGNNTNYALATANEGAGQAALLTSGRVAADRLVPRGSYAPGTACTEEAAIARNAAGVGSVMCINSIWRVQTTVATVGGACSPNGANAQGNSGESLVCVSGTWQSMADLFRSGSPGGACTTLNSTAIDVTNGFGTLLCRRNLGNSGSSLTWYRLADITTQIQQATSIEVTNGQVFTAPTCPVAGGQSALAIAQFRPRSETSSDGGFNRRAVPVSATQWQALLTNGAGQPLTSSSGSAVAVADIFCYYP